MIDSKWQVKETIIENIKKGYMSCTFDSLLDIEIVRDLLHKGYEVQPLRTEDPDTKKTQIKTVVSWGPKET